MFRYLVEQGGGDREFAIAAVLADYQASGAKGRLAFMEAGTAVGAGRTRGTDRTRARQARHVVKLDSV